MEAACNLAAQVIRQKDTEIAGLREELTDLKAESTGEKEEIYKPNRRKPKGGRVGASLGHPGGTRKKSARIDKQVRVYLSKCPHCNGRVKRCQGGNYCLLSQLRKYPAGGSGFKKRRSSGEIYGAKNYRREEYDWRIHFPQLPAGSYQRGRPRPCGKGLFPTRTKSLPSFPGQRWSLPIILRKGKSGRR